jgi:hypothetical protein
VTIFVTYMASANLVRTGRLSDFVREDFSMPKVNTEKLLFLFHEEEIKLKHVNEPNPSCFSFPYLFQVIFNILFILCLSPIWISFSNNQQEDYFKEFKCQKVSFQPENNPYSHVAFVE